MDASVLREIYGYWFGAVKAPDGPIPEQQMKTWFDPTPEVDAHIRETWSRF